MKNRRPRRNRRRGVNPILAAKSEAERKQEYMEGYNAYMREQERQMLEMLKECTSCEIITVSDDEEEEERAFEDPIVPICPICEGRHCADYCPWREDEEEEEKAFEDPIVPICPICAQGRHCADYCPWREGLPMDVAEVPKGYAISCLLCACPHNKCKHDWGHVINVECYICDAKGDHLTLECPNIRAKAKADSEARARARAEAEKRKEEAAEARARARAEAEANGTLECLLCHVKGDHLYSECSRLGAAMTKANSEFEEKMKEAAKGQDPKPKRGVLQPHLKVYFVR